MEEVYMLQGSDSYSEPTDLSSFGYLDPLTYIFVVGFLSGTMFTKYVLKS